ncbi:Spo0B domain-containing protein [Natranaerofaba carboxydovora]|uniref:Spo0B domain-containing protein n=1 Tax=Natranaerofaba carboxydovora TaxID=2742683 RepID=UPI001F131CA5|nr:Spo0B domain-containing protein [Natranaerofaba carboxydovora]UMZ72883.1 Sensor_kinase_SpoOB-type, alpha-helical domain [Natranaerofaba carboxydovora]
MKLLIGLLIGIIITFATPFLYYIYFYWFLAVMFFVIIYWIGFTLSFKNFFEFYLKEREKETYNNMVELLRAMRHEFINYFQVIQSLTELEQTEKLKDYLNTVNLEVDETGNILKIYHPEITLYLLNQLVEYNNKDIGFQLNVNTNMEKINESPNNITSFLDKIFNKINIEESNDITSCSIECEITEEAGYYPIIITVYDPSEPWKKEIDKLKDFKEVELYNWEEHLAIHMYIKKVKIEEGD